MTSVLITGTNRGIGLGLVKYFLNHSDPPKILIAACRNPTEATELQELKKKNSNLHLLQLDVTKFDSFADVAKKVDSIVGPNGLNVLINNAGAALKEKHKTFDDVTPEDYTYLYNINTLGPIFLTRALLPLIERAANANKDKPEGIKRAAILNISSTLGSVSLNNGLYPIMAPCYRESKSALNQASRSLALLVGPKGIVVTVFCPGHVKTDLGGPDAVLTVDDSISSLIKAILPLIERAANANKNKPEGFKRAAIFNMSSLLASVSLNFGSYHSYRESKAALNQHSRSLALLVEPKGIVVTVLHPGHVRTDMGGPDGQLSLDESVSGLVNVIYSTDKSKHNKFIQWDGKELTW